MDPDPKMQEGTTPDNNNNINTNVPATDQNTNPNPTPESTPVAAAAVNSANPPKKHTGLIVAIVAAILILLVGAGIAVWYFVIHSNPDKVAFDAINGFLHEHSVTVTGSAYNEQTYHSYRTRSTISLDSKRGATNLPASSTITAGFAQYENNSDDPEVDLSLELGSVVFSDGIIYFRINDLMEAVDSALASSGLSRSRLDDYGKLLYGIGEKIDGEWWQFSLPDILDLISADNSESYSSIRNAYNCVFEAASGDIAGELASIYSENRFIGITKVSQSAFGDVKATSGNSLYELTFDYEKMADFINSLPNSDYANKLYTCYNNFVAAEDLDDSGFIPRRISAADFDKVSAEDLAGSRNTETNNYYLEISNFDHKLKSLYAYEKSEDEQTEIHFYFQYEPVTISAPESYRPITELIEEVSVDVIKLSAAQQGIELIYDEEAQLWYLPDGTPVDLNITGIFGSLGSTTSDGDDIDDSYDDLWSDDDFWDDDPDDSPSSEEV